MKKQREKLITKEILKRVKKLLFVFNPNHSKFSTSEKTILSFKNNGLKSFLQFPQTHLNHNIFIYKN